MTKTTLTSREFNQDTARAKRAAQDGPVIITDRGTPAHVLLSIEHYNALVGPAPSIVELLGMRDGGRIDFEPPRLGRVSRRVDLG